MIMMMMMMEYMECKFINCESRRNECVGMRVHKCVGNGPGIGAHCKHANHGG